MAGAAHFAHPVTVRNQVVVGGRCTVTIGAQGSSAAPLAPGHRPTLVRRDPVRSLPRPPAAPLLGRDGDVARIDVAATPGTLIHVQGAAGSGKTALARHLARVLADQGEEVVFLEGAGRDVIDLVQDLCEACVDVDGFRPDATQLGGLMQDWRGCVVVDDLAATPEAITALRAAAPGACLIVTSSDPLDGAGAQVVRLSGLSLETATNLVERELGRPLEFAERAPVASLWQAVGGRPRELVQAIEVTCPTVDDHFTPVDAGRLAVTLVDRLDGPATYTLALLTALGPVTVGAGVLEAMVGRSPTDEIRRLARCGLVTTGASGHRVAASLAASPPPRLQLPPPEIGRAAAALTTWLASPAADPAAVEASGAAIARLVARTLEVGQAPAACALARAAAPMVGMSRRWGAWGRILELGATVARQAGDAGAATYFDHEQRVRSFALHRPATSAVPPARSGLPPPPPPPPAVAAAPPGAGAGQVLVPPLRLRLVAFLVDLLVVAAIEMVVTWAAGETRSLVSVVITFVAYQTAMVWLTGATVGKFMFGLEVRRVSDRPYQRRVGGLVWVLARSSLGYLVVDLGVVGVLVAVATPDHRPLHDLVFRSRVVCAPQPATSAHGLRGQVERMDRYGAEVDTALSQVRPPSQTLALARWLVSAGAALHFLRDRLRAVGEWIARAFQAQPTPATAGPTTTLAAGPTLAIVAASAAIVATAGVTAYDPAEEDPGLRTAYAVALVDTLPPDDVLLQFSGDEQTCFFEATVDAIGLDNLRAAWTPEDIRAQGTAFAFEGVDIDGLRDPGYADAVSGCLDLTRVLVLQFSFVAGRQPTPETVECVRQSFSEEEARQLFREEVILTLTQGGGELNTPLAQRLSDVLQLC